MPDIPKDYKRLEGSERHPAKHAEWLGSTDEHEKLEVTIVLRRRKDGPSPPGFDYFAKTPPAQRQRMPEDQFAAKYGAHPEDIKRVEEFARSQGLAVEEVHAARRSVRVSGTVAQMEKAFAVKLGRYRHTVLRRRGGRPQEEVYRGLDGFVHLPAGLIEIVVGVFGLDNRNITKHNGADPPVTVPLSTQTIAQLYDFPANQAAGQIIGILSTQGYLSSDISTLRRKSAPGYRRLGGWIGQWRIRGCRNHSGYLHRRPGGARRGGRGLFSAGHRTGVGRPLLQGRASRPRRSAVLRDFFQLLYLRRRRSGPRSPTKV